jgi:cadmium resistance protein CadD (predicted permease)
VNRVKDRFRVKARNMAGSGIVVRAIAAFAVSNIDGLVLLALLFSVRRGAGAGPRSQVVMGTFLGFTALVALSAGIATGLSGVPVHWFAFFGVVPFAIGVWGLVRLVVRTTSRPQPMLAGAGVVTVATLTIASGGDSVGVYVPLFRHLGGGALLLTSAVFMLLLGIWCALGEALATRARLVHLIDRGGRAAIPAAFMAAGLLVLSSLVI